MLKKHNLLDILNFVSTFCVSIIVLIAIALTVMRFSGLQGFTVESNSMSPTYPIDSFILVKDINPQQIETGDAITFVFNDDGLLVTHRVIAIDKNEKTFKTKGDNNNVPDSIPVLWDNVVGKVVFSIPKIGSIMRIITAEENRQYIVIIIALLLTISFVLDMAEKKRGKTSSENSCVKNKNFERKENVDGKK